MPPIESFIENLLEMRSHYQAQVNQCDRLIAHAQDGLIHVNALLVDEALDNQQFVENLLQMRSHYQATIDEQKRQLASAKEQLLHINALLAEQMLVQHENEQAISMQASTYKDNLALTQAALDEEIPLAVERSPTESTITEQVEVVDALSNRQFTSAAEPTNSTIIPPDALLEETTQNLQKSSFKAELPIVEAPLDNPIIIANQPKTPLLQQYQHLSRSEAVEKLLQENIGSILHTDYIIRALYGDLDAEAVKVEKQRLYATLSKGVDRGLWDKVPDQLGCYTIDLKLVEREVKSTGTKQAIKSDTAKAIKVLPAYQHLNFTQAVGTVLRENAGQVMNSEKIAKLLYGELEGKDLSKAKDKVGKILWAGARQKRWQSVAGKLGAYMMSLDNV